MLSNASASKDWQRMPREIVRLLCLARPWGTLMPNLSQIHMHVESLFLWPKRIIGQSPSCADVQQARCTMYLMYLLIIKEECSPLSYRSSSQVRHRLLASISISGSTFSYQHSTSIYNFHPTTSTVKLNFQPLYKHFNHLHNVSNHQRHYHPPRLQPPLHKVRHWRCRKHPQNHLNPHCPLRTTHDPNTFKRHLPHWHRRCRQLAVV